MISIKKAKEIIQNYKQVEFHKADGTIYHAKSLAEFKQMIFAK